MPVVLTLGPLLFADFEVPESINFGGKQILVKRTLVGGDRIIHAMGRDDDDIRWSGRFRGGAAEIRSRLGDFIRIKGQPLLLAWSSFRYLVAVEEFKADFRQDVEIPYNISCVVIKDLTSPLVNDVLSMDAAISSDVSEMAQIGAQLGIPGVSTAIAGVSTATADVESFEGAGSVVVSGMQGALIAAIGVVNAQSNALNATVASPGNIAGMSGDSDPVSLSSNLLAQSDAFSSLGSLYQLDALLGRTSTNVTSAATGISGVLAA
jgi:hypothetical protein